MIFGRSCTDETLPLLAMEPAEIHVALRIISETITAEEMIRSLPMPPDKTWSFGQLRRGTIIREVNNGVEYHSKNDGSSTLNSELNKLLRRMAPAFPALQRLPAECQMHVSCAIYS